MELQTLITTWTSQKVSHELDINILNKMKGFEKKVKSENLKTTILFSVSIFLLGFILLPFIDHSQTLMLLIAASMFIMGVQSLVLWMRVTHIDKTMISQPKAYIKSHISRLKYSLFVTNVMMPIYMLLIGCISSVYIYNIFQEVAAINSTIVISGMWVFYISIFTFSWRKQRKRDQENIIPMLENLAKWNLQKN